MIWRTFSRRVPSWPGARRAAGLAGELRAEAKTDRVTGLAAEVAFFVVLSVFPALLVLASALGFLGSILGDDLARDAQGEVLGFLEGVLTEDADGTVGAVRELFEREPAGLFTFGVLGATWATARGFAAVIRALNVAYDVGDGRTWARRQGIALLLSLVTVVVAAVVMAMVVVGPLLGAGSTVAGALGLGSAFATAWDWLRIPAVLLVLVAWATAVYTFGPDHRSSISESLPGAVLAAAWWLLASYGLRWGLSLSTGGNQVFGALGGALILLAWIYLLALGLLVGGELNATLMRHRPPTRGSPQDGESEASEAVVRPDGRVVQAQSAPLL